MSGHMGWRRTPGLSQDQRELYCRVEELGLAEFQGFS